MDYTAVCIGGSQDGSLITADRPRVIVAVPEKLNAASVFSADVLSYKPIKHEHYRAEQLDYGDRKRREIVLVEESLSMRQAFGMLLDAYTGSHIPVKSSRKEAEPSEVDALVGKIKMLEVVVKAQSVIIQDLRSEYGT